MPEKPNGGSRLGPFKGLIPVLLGKLSGFVTKRPLEPATFLHEVKVDLETQLGTGNTLDKAGLVAFLSDPNVVKKFDERAQELMAPFARDPRLLSFEQLIEDAEAKAPMRFLEDLARYYQDSQLNRLSETFEKLEDARSLTAEAQSLALKDCLGSVGELLYIPFLQLVLNLICRARGEPPETIDSLGKLVKSLEGKLPKDSPLLDKDAGWLRNGATHGYWKYLPETKQIKVWDRNHPPERFQPEELLRRVEAWFTLSVKIQQAVMQAFLAKNWAQITPQIFKELDPRNS